MLFSVLIAGLAKLAGAHPEDDACRASTIICDEHNDWTWYAEDQQLRGHRYRVFKHYYYEDVYMRGPKRLCTLKFRCD